MGASIFRVAKALTLAALLSTASTVRAAVRELPTALVDALHGADLNRAVSAAEQLGVLATPPARAALVRVLGLGAPPPLLLAALGALGQPGAADAVPILRHYATYRAPAVRVAALRALARVGGPEADETMIAALGDGDAAVREAAAGLAAELGLRTAEGALLMLVQRGEVTLLPALARVGGARTVAAMTTDASLQAAGPASRSIRAQLLGALLVREDFGPDPLRVRVVQTLAASGDSEAAAALARYLAAVPAEQQRPSRAAAARALQRRRR
ncbi:MAG: HEAT repeat domain-containing protein [Proteobacteria bacterium]|nr:HEAT repeat domain-containing protein [Pseudomonadota bacterium]